MLMKISKKYLNKNFWKNKKVLITGINGFIGGNLAQELIILGAKVTGISNNKKKNKFLVYENIHKKLYNAIKPCQKNILKPIRNLKELIKPITYTKPYAR